MNYLSEVTRQIIKNLIISTLLQCAIILAIYLAVQPDPKGLGMFICLTIYSWVMSVAGILAMVFKFSPDKILYEFFIVGNLIHVWFLVEICIEAQPLEFNFFHGLLLAGIGICAILWLNFVKTISYGKQNAS